MVNTYTWTIKSMSTLHLDRATSTAHIKAE